MSAPVDVLAVMDEMYGFVWRAHGNQNERANGALDRAEQARAAVAELIGASKAISANYGHIWDRADGCIVLMPERVEAFEVLSECLYSALARCGVQS